MTREAPPTTATPDSPVIEKPGASAPEPFARRPCLTLALREWVETLPPEERAAWLSEEPRSSE